VPEDEPTTRKSKFGPVPDTPDPSLLQALEHTLETLKRTTDVLTTALDTMQRGERFADATIADYRAQLENVKADRLRDGGNAAGALESGGEALAACGQGVFRLPPTRWRGAPEAARGCLTRPVTRPDAAWDMLPLSSRRMLRGRGPADETFRLSSEFRHRGECYDANRSR
jgi:hypothetical protein